MAQSTAQRDMVMAIDQISPATAHLNPSAYCYGLRFRPFLTDLDSSEDSVAASRQSRSAVIAAGLRKGAAVAELRAKVSQILQIGTVVEVNCAASLLTWPGYKEFVSCFLLSFFWLDIQLQVKEDVSDITYPRINYPSGTEAEARAVAVLMRITV